MNEPGPGAAADLIERIRHGRVRLIDQTRGLSNETLRTRPDAEEWSVIEVLAHLPDVNHHWLAHDENHVNQIAGIKSRLNQ